MAANPYSAWRQTSSTVVYSNPWIAVSHDEVITPGDTPGIYGVVHFKHHAGGVLPIDEDGYIWLVKQTRYVLGAPTWEIPEGGCPLGQCLLSAAQRELKEETGLLAEQWETLLEMDLSNSVTDEKATVFLARGLTQGESQREVTEDIEVQRLPLKEAIAMVLSGEIRDAISVAALLKASVIKL
jgi:8-oxo-dGTP pyrophosphatase MutT (NUDIX family)